MREGKTTISDLRNEKKNYYRTNTYRKLYQDKDNLGKTEIRDAFFGTVFS